MLTLNMQMFTGSRPKSVSALKLHIAGIINECTQILVKQQFINNDCDRK